MTNRYVFLATFKRCVDLEVLRLRPGDPVISDAIASGDHLTILVIASLAHSELTGIFSSLHLQSIAKSYNNVAFSPLPMALNLHYNALLGTEPYIALSWSSIPLRDLPILPSSDHEIEVK